MLVIKPGAHEIDIIARFGHVNLSEPLDEQAKFDALSYYWGDLSERFYIPVEPDTESAANPEIIGISRTLEGAIRLLRRPDVPLSIWIDAVCSTKMTSRREHSKWL